MAKITAHGTHKLAQAEHVRTDADGYTVRTVLALRSDGAILRAVHLRGPNDDRWSRGGYTIARRLTLGMPEDRQRAAFTRLCERYGFTVS